MKPRHLLLTFGMLYASLTYAQDWSSVSRLAGGTPVEVIHGNLKRAQGTLAGATADSITLRTDTGDATIPRTDVKRVSVRSASRSKRALIGAAIGSVALGAVAAIGAHTGDIDIRRDLVFGAGALAGAAGGAGIGAATSGPQTIYRAP